MTPVSSMDRRTTTLAFPPTPRVMPEAAPAVRAISTGSQRLDAVPGGRSAGRAPAAWGSAACAEERAGRGGSSGPPGAGGPGGRGRRLRAAPAADGDDD